MLGALEPLRRRSRTIVTGSSTRKKTVPPERAQLAETPLEHSSRRLSRTRLSTGATVSPGEAQTRTAGPPESDTEPAVAYGQALFEVSVAVLRSSPSATELSGRASLPIVSAKSPSAIEAGAGASKVTRTVVRDSPTALTKAAAPATGATAPSATVITTTQRSVRA